MDQVFEKYYRACYSRTGYIPTQPSGDNLYPGDFFQIRKGELIVLGNIYMNNLVSSENCYLSEPNPLNSSAWSFYNGVSKPYSGRGTGENVFEGQFEYSRQVLAFDSWGSFNFKGLNPESVRILNWNFLADELIIKLTQTNFSFRELYVVTESATTTDWTLAIASSDKGELEIATDSDNFGLVDIFGHPSSRTIQSKEIEFYNREEKRKPNFFKAKKLVVHENQLEVFVNDLINRRLGVYEWANEFYDYNFEYDPVSYSPHVSVNTQGSVLDMLQGNELNPNTALQYFKWTDAGQDDIDRLFEFYAA